MAPREIGSGGEQGFINEQRPNAIALRTIADIPKVLTRRCTQMLVKHV